MRQNDMQRNLEVLVSALKKDPKALAAHMNLECDAVIIDQTDKDGVFEFATDRSSVVRVFESRDRGIGKSRNMALDKAQGRIILFSDDDIVYTDGYSDRILQAFDQHPDADIIMFNFNVREERRTYHIDKTIRVHKWSVGRYPAYAAAAKLESINSTGVRFSPLFGGGAKYANGEDNLFFMDCLRSGLKIVAVPVTLGTEEPRESTWFKGYNEKFFKDRGVLYSFLYGNLAHLWAIRFILAKKRSYSDCIKPAAAYKIMKEGIREGKSVKKGLPN